jgi:hypothetical protein
VCGNAIAQDLSVENYCKIALESMQLEVEAMRALVTALKNFNGDVNSLAAYEAGVRNPYLEKQKDILVKYNTTEIEYAGFRGRFPSEVDEYLAQNAMLKQEIDTAGQTAGQLLEEYEAERERLTGVTTVDSAVNLPPP